MFESYTYDDIALNLPFTESPFDRPVINTCKEFKQNSSLNEKNEISNIILKNNINTTVVSSSA
jgi:hypothetical protein